MNFGGQKIGCKINCVAIYSPNKQTLLWEGIVTMTNEVLDSVMGDF